MSLFCCPVCGAPLRREEGRYLCGSGHSFDVAAEGYVHLLPANRKHSKDPGDDRAMVTARADFLAKGFYGALERALADAAVRCAPTPCAVLDAGCGEGTYTAGVRAALERAGKQPEMAAVDISKWAVRRCARRLPGTECAVASCCRLPLAAESVDLVMDCFAPLAAEEFRRVLRPGGTFLYVVPGPRHLYGLKEALYDAPYENEEKRVLYPGFSYREVRPVEDTLTLREPADIAALLGMTPYAWKTSRAGKERLLARETLTTELSFRIHIFRKD